MQIYDAFVSRPGCGSARLPDGTQAVLACEHAASILVNGQPAFRVVCTPALLPQMALGRLLTEGWIASAGEVDRISVCADGSRIEAALTHPLAAPRTAVQEVASSTDNLPLAQPAERQPLRPSPSLALQPEWLETLTAAMSAGLPLYQATRSVHSCLMMRRGQILYQCEDIGRHNALDKAVGCALLDGVPLAECILYTSGRVPEDMVRKAIRAGAGALISKSMPTLSSLGLAEKYGLQLLCARKHPRSVS